MNRAQARALHLSLLMDHIRADPYPSSTHMDLVEQSLPASPEMAADYMQILAEKVSSTNHPSPSMLRRLGVVAELFPAR
jgi:hypothetical protein